MFFRVPSSRVREGSLAGLVLAGAVAFLLWNRLLGLTPPAQSFIDLDIREYFFPSFEFLRRSVLSGELPLWNPYQLAGYPFAATLQPAVYYPLLAGLIPLPTALALSVHLVLHVWLAGAFVWAFARGQRLGLPAALGAALTYMLSAPIMTAVFNTAMLSTMVWLPAIFWRLDRYASRSDGRNVALLAVVLAMSFLAGSPQIFLYTSLAGAAYGIFFLLGFGGLSPGTRTRFLTGSLGAAVVAFLLVGVQALPTLELVAGASRHLDGLGASTGSIFEGVRNTPILSLRPGGALVGVPVLFLPLALLAVLFATPLDRPRVTFFSVMCLITLDLVRADGGVLFGIFTKIPMVATFREPERIAFVASFSAAMLVAYGLEAMRALRLCGPTAAMIASLLLSGLVGVDGYLLNAPQGHFPPMAHPESFDAPRVLREFSDRHAGSGRFFIDDFYQTDAFPQNSGEAVGIAVLNAYEPLLPAEYERAFDIPRTTFWTGKLTLLDVFKTNPTFRPMPRN